MTGLHRNMYSFNLIMTQITQEMKMQMSTKPEDGPYKIQSSSYQLR